MYVIKPETFIEIDSPQHFKISRQTYPTNHYKDYVKRFLKKFVEVLSEIHKKALKVQILNEVVLRHAGGEKTGYF